MTSVLNNKMDNVAVNQIKKTMEHKEDFTNIYSAKDQNTILSYCGNIIFFGS